MANLRATASVLAVCLGAGCATPSYMLFHERYAGTCQVASPPSAATTTSVASPRAAAFVDALNDRDLELRECYMDSLRYGETHGKVRLQVELRADGKVEPVTLLSDTTSFPALACCVVSLVRELHVKPTADAAAVSFEYQFWFRTIRSTGALGLGVPLTHSGATRKGYLAELDEASVAIGGNLMYPTAPDGIHYHTDREQGD